MDRSLTHGALSDASRANGRDIRTLSAGTDVSSHTTGKNARDVLRVHGRHLAQGDAEAQATDHNIRRPLRQ